MYKKGEISNKALAVLVVLAIVISVGSTMMVLDKIKLKATGAATGIAKVDVTGVIAITLPVSTVDFGSIFQGYSDNTTDGNPAPLKIQNDGGVNVNVSIARDGSSSWLFSGTGGGDNTSSFQFKIDQTIETGSFNFGASTTNWTNVPGTTPLDDVLAELKYQDSTDSAEVDLLINVPSDEAPGAKNETLVFIAEQS